MICMFPFIRTKTIFIKVACCYTNINKNMMNKLTCEVQFEKTIELGLLLKTKVFLITETKITKNL